MRKSGFTKKLRKVPAELPPPRARPRAMKRSVVFALALCGAIGGSPPAECREAHPRACVLVVDAAGLAPLPDSTVVLRPVRKDEGAGRDGV